MSFESALSGLQGSQTQLDVIGNDIANANTTGYKSSRVEFADVFANSGIGGTALVGSGVQVSQVSKQFSQGAVSFTDGPLDLAIGGEGFFRMNNGGLVEYTRNGAFGVNKDGNIVNGGGAVLTGFQVDANNAITGNLGDLTIPTTDLDPKATSTASMGLNLDAAAKVPSGEWVGTSSFGGTVPSSSTYNNTNIATVYDSLGNSHTLTTYFVKSGEANTWNVHVQMDGVDVSSTLKSGLTTDGTLTTAGSLTALTTGELTINGTDVGAGADDGVSTSDPAASAIAIAARINTVADVTAKALPNTLNLGAFTADTLTSGQFQINNQNIVLANATKGGLLTAINDESATTGVTASEDSTGFIVLTAADGRNIEVQTDGSATTSSFTNFDLTGGSTVNSVKRGQVLIESAANVTVAGTNPADGALTAGTINGQTAEPFKLVFKNNGALDTVASDTISVTWSPLNPVGIANGATSPQTITMTMDDSTQFGTPFSVDAIGQDGFTTGRLSDVDIDSTGVIFGRYSNGESQSLGQVVLSKFRNPQGLKSLGDSAFGSTSTSGVAVTGAPSSGNFGSLQSSALEDSNVKLTERLVDLIEAQRGFQANAQTIRTEDAVTQAILNIR